MPGFSIRKIILYNFTFDNNKSESGICYKMIIVRDLMLHLGLMANSKHQFLQWDDAAVPMMYLSSLLGQTYLTIRNIREVAMKTV